MLSRAGIHRLIPRRLRRADLALFRKIALTEVPVVGPILPPLSRAADYSRLWMAIALALALFSGRAGQRAATRGVLCVAATSLFVNQPAKYLAGRVRPDWDVVPEVRRLLRVPASSSFPSGHSASAFAFAVGASQEMPALAWPLGLLASAVAFSRIYTGVHYPADVLAGVAMGSAFAVASRRLWPVEASPPR
ncbi:MAG: phosphatase PAP2 family protein [Actinomycetota bacterium]|nr:phosphatase PAP2 family protein [Actinomycetota bacterium]